MIVKTSQNIIARIKSITVVIDKLLTPSQSTIKYLNLVLSYCKRFSVTFLFVSLFLLTPSSTSALELSSLPRSNVIMQAGMFSLSKVIESIPNLRVTDTIHNLSKANNNLFTLAKGESWINKNTLSIYPITNRGEILGVSTTTSSLAANTITNSFINTFPSNIFCKLGFLIENVDTSYCDTVTDTNTTTTVVNTTDVPTTPTASTTTSVSVNNLDSNPQLETKNLKLETSPIYITQYVNKYITVPGPQGPAGPQGLPGKDAIYIPAPTTYQSPSNNYISYFPPTPSVSLVKVSTVDYLRDTTIEYPKITNGTADNLSLSSATVRNSVFSGANTFNDSANFTGSVSVNSLTATNSVLTNATSTNLYVSNSTFIDSILTNSTTTNATTTNQYVTRLTVDDARITNSTTTNLYATNSTFLNSTFTSATSTNLFSTNSTSINATSTNFFATNSKFIDSIFTNSTTTNLFADNSQFTNATSTNLYATNSTFIDSTFTNSTSTRFFSTNSFFTNATSTNLYATNSIFIDSIFTSATSTNWFSTNSTSINATSTNFFVSNLSSTNSILTNSTSTNLHVTNLTADDSQFTNATSSTLYATTLNAVSASTTNLTVASTTYFGNNTGIWNASGNVGIGTTTPQSSLVVVPSTTATGIIIDGNVSGAISPVLRINLDSVNKTVLGTASASGGLFTGSTVGDTILKNQSVNALLFGTSNVERMRIDSAGSVGIGTTAPGGKTEIFQTSTTVPAMRLRYNSSSYYADLLMNPSGNAVLSIPATNGVTSGNFSINLNNYLAAGYAYQINGDGSHMWADGLGHQRMTIDTNGNVGIGTTNPGTNKLEVNGNVNIYQSAVSNSNITLRNSTTGNTAGLGIQQDGVNTNVYNNSNGYMQFATNSTAAMTILNSGNIGIGTTNPSAKLEIYTGNGTSGLKTSLICSNATTNKLYTDGSGNIVCGTDQTGGGSGNLVDTLAATLGSGNDAGGTNMVNLGSVGIGTTNPGQRLSVEGSGTANENIVRFNNEGNYASRIWLRNSGRSAYFSQAGGTADTIATDLLPGALSFGMGSAISPIQFWNGSPSAVKMTIATDGKIGIGTTTPDYELEVSKSTANNQIYSSVVGDYFPGIGIRRTGASVKTNIDWNMMIGSSGSFNIKNGGLNSSVAPLVIENGAVSNILYLNSAGNVGIGTTTPGVKLDISGGTVAIDNNQYYKGRDTGGTARNIIGFTTGNILNIQNNANAVGGDVSIYTGTAPTQGIYIQNGGNVGIGTTSPSSTLDVNGTLTLSASSGTLNATGVSGGYLSATQQQMYVQSNSGVLLRGYTPNYYTYAAFDNSNSIFYTNNQTERMRINSSGYVGIGTTNPTYKLSVNNEAVLGSGVNTVMRLAGGQMSTAGDATRLLFVQRGANDDYGGAIQLTTTNNSPGYLQPRLDFLVQQTSTNVLSSMATMMSILGSGNVGIGTTAPGTLLQVGATTLAKTAIGQSLITLGSRITVGDVQELGLGRDPGATLPISAIGNIITAQDAFAKGALYFATRDVTTDTAPTERMRITAAGNVGIGTTAPEQQFDVYTAGADPTTTVQIRANRTAYGNVRSQWGVYASGVEATNRMTLGIGNNLNAFTINGIGNVGIGTTTPGALLHLSSSSINGTHLQIQNTDTGGKTWEIVSTGSNNGAGAGKLFFYDGLVSPMTLSSGNVGIGTTTPGSKLDVYGETRIGGSSGQFWIGTSGSGGYIQNSAIGSATRFFTSNASVGDTEAMRILSNGNVGIGTTAPNGKLGLANGGTIAWPLSNSYTWEIYKSVNSLHLAYGSNDAFSDAADALTLIGGTTPTVAVTGTLTATGNVGIGTTAPLANLDVSVATGNVNFMLGRSVASGRSGIIRKDTDNSPWPLDIIGSASTVSDNSDIRFFTYDAIAGQKMVIKNITGNVGIGTTTPSQKLDVVGNIKLNGANNGNVAKLILTRTDTSWSINNETNLRFYGGAGNVDNPTSLNMEITGAGNVSIPAGALTVSGAGNSSFVGNVGIGTTNPSTKLEVADSIRSTNWKATGAGTGNGPGIEMEYIGPNGAGALLSYNRTTGESLRQDYYASSHYFDGNVGIGTVAPPSQLGVAGSASVGATYGSIAAPSSGMIIEGNVGIGTTTPVARLDVAGAGVSNSGIRSDGIRSLVSDANNQSVAGYFSTAGQNGAYSLMTGQGAIKFGNTGTSSITMNGNLTMYAYPEATTGNLLVGDNTANYAAGFGGIISMSGDTVGQEGGGTRSVFASIRGIKENGTYTNSLGALTFGTQSSSADQANLTTVTERMRITSSGNVGIGTTVPLGKLDVSGDLILSTSVANPGITLSSDRNITYYDNNGGSIAAKILFSQLDYGNEPGQLSFWTKPSDADGGGALGQRLTITSKGNVGIGTTAPDMNLTVKSAYNGGIDVSNYIDSTLVLTPNAANSPMVSSGGGSQSLLFGINLVEKMRILNNGNVGIGTTAPGSKLAVSGGVSIGSTYVASTIADGNLAVSGNILTPGTIRSISNSDSDSNPILLSRQVVVGSTNAIAYGYGGGGLIASKSNAAGTILLDVGSASGSNNLKVINDGTGLTGSMTYMGGNVGIGTTGPSTKLEVSGSGGTTLTVNNTTSGAAQICLDGNGGDCSGTDYGLLYQSAALDTNLFNQYSTGNLIFGTNGSERMRITSAGNVGIGTSPVSTTGLSLYRSPVGSSVVTGLDVSATSNAGYITAYGITATANNAYGAAGVGIKGTSQSFSYAHAGPGIGVYGISSINYTAANLTGIGIKGEVGGGDAAGGTGNSTFAGYFINTSVGGAGISNYGIYAQNLDSDTYAIYCDAVNNVSGCGGNRAWTNASDSRLKENITTIPNALETVNHLRGVNFNWKQGGQADTGFIAQEVLPYFPQVVSMSDNGYYGMRTGSLTGLLVESVKELNIKTNLAQTTASSTQDNLESIASTTVSTSTPNSFVSRFFSNLFTRITTWLADAGNGIGDFFANRVKTKELCVSDGSSETCITKAKLDALLKNYADSIPNTPIPSASPVIPPSPEPTVAGTSTTGVADSNQQTATSTDPVTPTIDPVVATSTDPVTPPVDPVITPVDLPAVDPVQPVDPVVIDPAI